VEVNPDFSFFFPKKKSQFYKQFPHQKAQLLSIGSQVHHPDTLTSCSLDLLMLCLNTK